MAEEGAGQQEQGEQGKQLEILDLEKHGAVYGRFLLASLPGAEIRNILDPDKTVGFDDLTAVAVGKRNYNPVFENYSFAERKEEWKEVPSFDDAYNQWRTKFTDFMINIQDPKRALALRTILSSHKEAKGFTVSDADRLFNEFCKGESNITGFAVRIMVNLSVNGKINSENLQELLPHLEWIASGLFGKNTASTIVTRLIELESSIYNRPMAVLESLNSNKDRINNPTENEREVLGLLRDSLPVSQEGEVIVPTKKIEEPVVSADVPQPVSVISDEGEVPAQPAPVIPEVIPDEEDDDELPVAPLGSKTPTIPVSSVPPEEAVNALEQKAKMAEKTLEAANKASFEAYNVYKEALLQYESRERIFKETEPGKVIWKRLDASWIAGEAARKALKQARADLASSSGVVQPATEQLSPEQQEIQKKFEEYLKTQTSRISPYAHKEIGPLLYNGIIRAIFANELAQAILNADTPREFTHVIILAGDVFQTPGLTHNLVEAFFAKNPELKDPNVFWIPQLLPEYDIVRNALADRLQEKGRSFLEDYDSASVLVDIKYTKGSIEEFIAELRRPRQLQDF